MHPKRIAKAALGLSLVSVWTWQHDLVAQAQKVQIPIFEYDPSFPKPLPENWAIGPIGGLAVDRQDHLYVVQRPGGLLTNERFSGADDNPPKADCCVPAPPVLEFDQRGTLIHSWGGPGPGYDWPQTEHGVFVDHKDVVWLAGSGAKDAQLLKFTREGKFLQQFGKPGMSGGSADTKNMGSPANLVVDAATNEVYVADGYSNHRVIVLDADTFAFKRMWGAYGNKPDDTPVVGPVNPHRGRENAAQPADRGAAHDPNAPPQQQFGNPVHCVIISKDDLVYVCDRQGDRLQVFTKDGKFVKEKLIEPKTMNAGSVWDVALSSDPQQTFLYVADGENSLIHILRRDTLDILTAFGEGGRQPGQWHGVHNIATDSQGNIYTTETYEGKRIQKFTFKGVKPVTKPYQGTPWPASAK